MTESLIEKLEALRITDKNKGYIGGIVRHQLSANRMLDKCIAIIREHTTPDRDTLLSELEDLAYSAGDERNTQIIELDQATATVRELFANDINVASKPQATESPVNAELIDALDAAIANGEANQAIDVYMVLALKRLRQHLVSCEISFDKKTNEQDSALGSGSTLADDTLKPDMAFNPLVTPRTTTPFPSPNAPDQPVELPQPTTAFGAACIAFDATSHHDSDIVDREALWEAIQAYLRATERERQPDGLPSPTRYTDGTTSREYEEAAQPDVFIKKTLHEELARAFHAGEHPGMYLLGRHVDSIIEKLRPYLRPSERESVHLTQSEQRFMHKALGRSLKRVDAWQPIETAPKDGTEVLLYSEEWQTCFAGWWEEEGGPWLDNFGCGAIYTATHWMPFPKPPEDRRKS